MLTFLVTGSFSGNRFHNKLNATLEDLQNNGHEIIDIKYAQSIRRVSALILYK
ncbi:hypothetical protein LQZ24_04435 [Fructobacillus sp. M1-13]|uniref:Uncharacterized protein n=1 Tax=Fructobacillus papyriferae TaxID=2713171 RepID=A0ABS5QU93_9LACO|nr:hypothetical protein [Fructobacillus papyriferae]MBS9335502.1 hypothetical protein [Fructobacillus papyriferae]MCD2159272.1 hypothetical protein [Fructobacillus papyriferae]